MIVELIRLQNVGKFRQPARLGPLASGLNILGAPNEEGKSTLLKATARALFDRHSSKSSEIRDLQPVGSDLAPEITVVFATHAGKFQIRKRFLHSPESRFFEWAQEQWQLKAEGDQADSLVIEQLGADRPSKGASKPEHWGLLRYLWARQNEPPAWPNWEGQTGEQIRSSLAHIQIDPLVDQVQDAVTAIFREQCTPTGKVKASGELHAAQKTLEELERQLGEIEAKKQHVEAQQEEYQKLAAQLAVLEEQKSAAEREWQGLVKQAREVESLKHQVDQLQQAYNTVNQRLQKVREDQKTLASLTERQEKQSQEQARLAKELEDQKQQEEALRTQQTTTRQSLETAKKEQRAIQSRIGHYQNAIQWKQENDLLSREQERLEKVESCEQQIGALQARRDRLPKVASQTLSTLKNDALELRDLKARLDQIGLTVRLKPDHETTVEAERDGETEHYRIEASQSQSVHGAHSLRLTLSSWGSIEITSGAEEIHTLREQYERNCTRFEATLKEYGVQSLEDLITLSTQRKELEQQIKAAEQRLSDLLEEHRDKPALQQRIHERERRIAALEEELTEIEALRRESLDSLHTEAEKARAEHQTVEEKLHELQHRSAQIDSQIETLLEKKSHCESQIQETRIQLERDRSQFQTIQERYPEGLEQALSQAQEEFVQSEARLKTAQAQLPPDWEKIPNRSERAAKAAEQAQTEYAKTKDRLLRLEGELTNQGAQGLYSEETRLVEQIDRYRREVERLKRRSGTAGLLKMLIEHRKTGTLKRVLKPLEDQLSATFAELTNDPGRRVFLNESLQVAGIGAKYEESIPFEQLSQGAKEQLLLALRAAVARELAKYHPQMLILDDVLVNTDPFRQQRVLDFLATLSSSIQILVLTCHSERYRGAGTFVQIEPVARHTDPVSTTSSSH